MIKASPTPESITPERLAEIRQRATAEHLTPGPWPLDYEQCDCSDGYCGHGSYVNAVVTPEVGILAAERLERTGGEPKDYDYHRTEIGDFTEADWELMVHAREDVPALLAEVERLKARLSAVLDICDREQRNAIRWENPIPVPEWVAPVQRAALGDDKRAEAQDGGAR